MISIVGGGPAGSYSAYLLAKSGFEVQVFEEHGVVGIPVACTGLLIPYLGKLFDTEDFEMNRVEMARIIAPDSGFVDVHFREPNFVLDRAALDQSIARRAQKAGAVYHLNHRFTGLSREGGKLQLEVLNKESGEKITSAADYLIGADGPHSSVAKSAGMYGDRTFYAAVQATIACENDNFIEFYPFGTDMAWVVPESKTSVRAGIAALKEPHLVFRKFMEKRFGAGFEEKITARQAGLIPLYNPRLATEKNNVLLVGDAATQVKAPTLGGIMQSLLAAGCAAEAIEKKKRYDTLWKRKIGKDLAMALMARKVMNKFTDEDYNRLVRACNTEKVRNILGSYDRDFISQFLVKMVLTQPKLLYFAKFLPSALSAS